MQNILRLSLCWLLVLGCCVGIFLLSAQSGETSAELSSNSFGPLYRLLTGLFGEAGHTVLRKMAHFSQYALLMFLCYNAFYRTRRNKPLHPFLPLLSCVLYAVSDEIHQYFVPGRACRIFDIGVDTFGCIIGGLCFYILVRISLSVRARKAFKSASKNGGKT